MHRRAFTLIELLVVIVIIAVLSTLCFSFYATMKDRALCAKDAGQLRVIAAAVLSRAGDNDGRLYTKDEVGNSSFRVYNDKLSLCQIVLPYLNDKPVWTSPRPHPRTVAYGNSYAWSRAKGITEAVLGATISLNSTVLLWNNHSYITPSPQNYPDPAANGGPSQASEANRIKPWRNGKMQNWVYGDGHVETF